jgi:hypothetical protein
MPSTNIIHVLLPMFLRQIPLRLPTQRPPRIHLIRPRTLHIGRQLGPSLLPDPAHLLLTGRDPLGALHRGDLFNIHGIELLEGAALAFNDEKVDDEGGDEVAGGEDVAVAEVDGFGDEWGEERDEEVPEPVGG